LVDRTITVYIRDGKVYKIDAAPTTEVLYGVVQATTRKVSGTQVVVVGKILTAGGAVEYEVTLPSDYNYATIVNKVVYAEISGNSATLRVLSAEQNGVFKRVKSVTSTGITIITTEASSGVSEVTADYTYTDDTLWLDAKSSSISSWTTRPVPAYEDDEVILYVDTVKDGSGSRKVVVGVVKQYK